MVLLEVKQSDNLKNITVPNDMSGHCLTLRRNDMDEMSTGGG